MQRIVMVAVLVVAALSCCVHGLISGMSLGVRVRASNALSMVYVPDGLTAEQYKALKEKEAAKLKNLGKRQQRIAAVADSQETRCCFDLVHADEATAAASDCSSVDPDDYDFESPPAKKYTTSKGKGRAGPAAGGSAKASPVAVDVPGGAAAGASDPRSPHFEAPWLRKMAALIDGREAAQVKMSQDQPDLLPGEEFRCVFAHKQNCLHTNILPHDCPADVYFGSNFNRFYRMAEGKKRWISSLTLPYGGVYPEVGFSWKRSQITPQTHLVMAAMFIGPAPEVHDVDHINSTSGQDAPDTYTRLLQPWQYNFATNQRYLTEKQNRTRPKAIPQEQRAQPRHPAYRKPEPDDPCILSNTGHARYKDSKKLINQNPYNEGHYQVVFAERREDGTGKRQLTRSFSVHVMVYQLFRSDRPEDGQPPMQFKPGTTRPVSSHVVHHRDGVPSNNDISNLTYITRKVRPLGGP
ncbi:hypothetical protein JKP88DRAFT_254836 [Tribonema minus]|uniref:HNH nuclease domain-containing protein n=1 Tax=Tribonema minus TaxID=303371 RepID=A0A836CHP1_9STRA|nr:hypothetical protein JKP88DRAFT_254836 [Tribonema minus]